MIILNFSKRRLKKIRKKAPDYKSTQKKYCQRKDGTMKLEKRALIIGTASLVISVIGIVIMLLIAQDWTIRQGKSIWNHIIALMSFYFAIAKFLFLTTEGRQIIISLLVIGIVIWLVFFEKRFRKLINKVEPVSSFDIEEYEEEISKAIGSEHLVILECLIRQEGSTDSDTLRQDYQRIAGEIDLLDLNIFFFDLLEVGYIKIVGQDSIGNKVYSITRQGIKYAKECHKVADKDWDDDSPL